LIENDPISSHYTSVGNENKKPVSQEHSFQSLASKKSKAGLSRATYKSKGEKENDTSILTMAGSDVLAP
jgi:hypothetical protein